MATITKVKTAKGDRWRVRVVKGYKPNGDPLQEMRSFASQKEAAAWGKARETDLARGVAGDASKMRLGEFLVEWEARAAKRVRPTTLHGYRAMLNGHILPALSGVRLRELSRASLQRWVDGLPTPDTAHRAYGVLHAALAEAVDLDLLAHNPASRLKLPDRGWRAGTSWSAEEARAFLAAAAGHRMQPYWTLAVRCGLRPSELLGLRWCDVDLEAGTLSVRQARPTVGGTRFTGSPKSASGARTLDLPADVLAALRTHKAAQIGRQLKTEPGKWQDLDLVCGGSSGQVQHYADLTRQFKDLAAAAGVRPIRLYDLRHTAITLMAEAGGDFKAVSEIAGHADARITRRVYQHVNRKQRAAALDALGQALAMPAPPAAKKR